MNAPLLRGNGISQAPVCCSAAARLTNGAEIYPHLPHLADKRIWICDDCGAYVGCHPNSTIALGSPAGPELRAQRGAVHRKLDPLWQQAHLIDAYKHTTKGVQRGIRDIARKRCYAWLAHKMKLKPEDCHVGMLTIEQCNIAFRVLHGVRYEDIRDWSRHQSTEGEAA